VSDLSNSELAKATNKELRQAGRLRESSTTLLEAGAFGRFKAHLGALGGRTAFVTEQNNKIVAAFDNALKRQHIDTPLRDFAVKQLRAQVTELNAKKTLLSFTNLDAALKALDHQAHETVLSYLPARAENQGSVFDTQEDGAQFKALAEKHGLNTPELREKFRAGLEARLFGTATSPQAGPQTAFHYLADFAEEAAVGAHPSKSYDKPVKELFAEFPHGLDKPKSLSDGHYQIQGKSEGGSQTFLFFKRVNAENIPYDCQGALDQRTAQLTGSTAAAETPAAKGEWIDSNQKFHFSVDKSALQDGKAWPILHKLLSSEENPFLQWKIGNPLGLAACRDLEVSDIKHDFFEKGPTLISTTGSERRHKPIPQLESIVASLINEQKARESLLADNTITQKDFDKFALEIEARQAELAFVKNSYKQKLEDASGDRCIDGAQFTLYTQHNPEQPWQLGEVQRYTKFLAKLEQILTSEGIPPGNLPASDVAVPGLSYATFRDEAVSDAAEADNPGLNYQNPPAWLLDNYRNTPFHQLAVQAGEAQVASSALKA
jgi:hypothetical protein